MYNLYLNHIFWTEVWKMCEINSENRMGGFNSIFYFFLKMFHPQIIFGVNLILFNV